MTNTQSNVKERSKVIIRPPKKYTVFILNDDKTAIECVIIVLMKVFFKDIKEATAITFDAHNNGKAKVGEYTKDVAYSKVAAAREFAASLDCPDLKFDVIKED